MSSVLIADSGSTKTQWCLVSGNKKRSVTTQGISPYFLNDEGLNNILRGELALKLGDVLPAEVYYYGTGCSNPANVSLIKRGLKKIYPAAKITVEHDLTGAAKALCGDEKGVVCILGTGSNSGYYNGKKIVKNSPGLGFILGDEGSGAYLGRKVLQYYLYKTFDAELEEKFLQKYPGNASEILDNVYKKPLPNRYLSGFAAFLAENRGHYMVENIIEDSFNDFFFTHLYKYSESWTMPIHFTGSIAYGFRDVLAQMCLDYELQLGKVLKEPMTGLVKYHGS
ncbi:MAG: N-acetylglucosamine kinase [Ferruginibacter sp.]